MRERNDERGKEIYALSERLFIRRRRRYLQIPYFAAVVLIGLLILGVSWLIVDSSDFLAREAYLVYPIFGATILFVGVEGLRMARRVDRLAKYEKGICPLFKRAVPFRVWQIPLKENLFIPYDEIVDIDAGTWMGRQMPTYEGRPMLWVLKTRNDLFSISVPYLGTLLKKVPDEGFNRVCDILTRTAEVFKKKKAIADRTGGSSSRSGAGYGTM